MKQHHILFILLAPFLLVVSLLPSGCTYNDGLLEITPPIDTTVQISFADDILPVFSDKCASPTCHGAGGISPELTPAKAYSELFAGGFIDTLAPAQSELYKWMTGQYALSMPLSGPDPDLNVKVLTWITQGAKDN